MGASLPSNRFTSLAARTILDRPNALRISGLCSVARIMLRVQRELTGSAQGLSLTWILLGLVVWALGLLVVLALMRMAGDQDRAARHEEILMDPFSDVQITQTGDG